MAVAAAHGTTALWFITRATGITALILLTVTVALGVANVRRLRPGALPRFVLEAVHRNVALLSVTFLVAHIATSVLDGYVPVRWLDAVVPFGSAYRPFWLGLGAIAFDLLIAVTLTSLVRRRLGYRAWRTTHWLAYGSWPIALVHGLGMGSDAGAGWSIVVTLGCVAVVLIAVAVRLAGRHAAPAPTPVRPAPPSRLAPRRPILSSGGGRR